MTSFIKVTSFDPLQIEGIPGPAGPQGLQGASGPQGPQGPEGTPVPLTVTGTQTTDYTANANEAVTTDNTVNGADIAVTLPTGVIRTDRVTVDNINLTAPAVTKVVCQAGVTFEDGSTVKVIDHPKMGYDCEYLGNQVWRARVSLPPSALTQDFDAAGAAQGVTNALSPRISNLENRATYPGPPPKSFSLRADGNLVVGTLADPGHFVEYGFTAVVARLVAGSVTGSGTVQVIVNGTVAYTFNLVAGTTTYNDTAASIVIPDGALVTLNCTSAGGAANLEFTFSEASGTPVTLPPTIGTVTVDSTTAQAGGAVVTFEYSAKDAQDNLDHFEVWVATGSTPPGTPGTGTLAATVSPSGTVGTYTVQITGLSASTAYAVSVFPVGAANNVGSAGTATFTTTAPDITPPGSGTLALQSGTKSSVGGTLVYTPDPASPDFGGIWLREQGGSTTPPPTITSGRPANSGTGGTGSGLWVPGNGDLSPLYITINDGHASTNYAFSAFPQDTANPPNIQQTPATCHFITSTAPSGAQGQYGLIPQAFVPNYSQDFSGLTTATLSNDFAIDNAWAHQTQGPSRREHWTVVDDGSGTNNILRLTAQFVSNGWANSSSSVYQKHPEYFGGVTNGSGRYGARGNLAGSGHQFTYGGWEIRCRALAPFVTGWKGGTVMLWPEPYTAGGPSPWPQDELDIWEVFNNNERQSNLHYNDGTKSAGTQISIKATYDITQWTYVTCLFEKPNATTGDPARLRLWYNGVLIFDTGQPSTSTAAYPAGTSQTKINYLLNNPPPLQFGLSLAYTNYDTLGFGSNPGAQYFDVDSINMWTAP